MEKQEQRRHLEKDYLDNELNPNCKKINEYPYYPIGRGASIFSGYAFKSKDFCDHGIPIIKIKNVNNRTVNLNDTQFIPECMLTPKIKKYFLDDKDVLIAMTGQGSVGRVGQIRTKDKYLLNQRVGKFVIDEKNLNSNYLFYVISSPEYEKILFDAGYGSGQPNLSPDTIKSIEIPYPPYTEQVIIGKILFTLDDKIELNHQMNKTLEQIAQTLFKRWFIDFEFPDENGNPYKSSSGRMVDSELGEIPERWKVGKLGDIADEKRKNVKVEDLNPEIPYFGLEHIPRKSISLSEWGNANEVSSNKLIFEKDDVLFGKLRPYFHKVGVAPIDGVCSTDIIVISPEEDYYSFILSIVSSEKFVEYATQTSDGTKMPRANWKTLVKYPVVIPDKLTSKRYNEIVSAFVDIMHKNIFECKNISQIRDSLLPKLMSGKIRVQV